MDQERNNLIVSLSVVSQDGCSQVLSPPRERSMFDHLRQNRFFVIVYTTGAQKWHIVSLLGDVTSPTTAIHYVSMTLIYVFEYREALTATTTAHGVHKQECTVQGGVHSSPLNK